MKPLNQKERNNLFVKFIIVFLVTVGITVFAIFYDFNLPAQLRQEQRSKLNSYNTFLKSQKKILKQIDTLNAQIEGMGTSNKDWTIQKELIVKQISFGVGDSSILVMNKLNAIYLNYLQARASELGYKDKLSDCQNKMGESEKNHKEKEELLKDKIELSKPN